jgi:hypothetical protein
MLKKENLVGLLQVREEALDKRHQKQERINQKLLDKSRISPRSYEANKEKLEKWVT